MSVETKVFGGQVLETKQSTVNGVPVGVFDAYLATWDPDLGGRYGVPDQFVRGAWRNSLQQHRERRMRQVRLKDQHGVIVGGYPIDGVYEDDVGLRGTGHVNLEKQAGRELWSLMRQEVIVDMSVSYIALQDKLEDGVRKIFEAQLIEASPVDEPNNQQAQVIELKAVVPFQDLPLAPRDRAWNSAAAIRRVRAQTGSQDAPSSGYRNAFLWYDSANSKEFGAYKLPIADAIDGRLMAVPRAIFAAAGAMRGARGGVQIPEADRARVVRHLERYYAKMDEESPFESRERQFVRAVEVQGMTSEQFEDVLRRGASWSKAAARLAVEKMGGLRRGTDMQYAGDEGIAKLVASMRDAARAVREGRAART